MLINDYRVIGNRLLAIRKGMGLTQAQVAEAAGLSDRTYADIERGSVNMRLQTLLAICAALHITPDEITTDDTSKLDAREEEIFQRLRTCAPKDRETALRLLSVFLQSLSDK
ncbi:MAG: helix-turn-helix transcriptional regulator [Peptococcaceae bacterium]|nr:helix-turn-helix transcriptional regulator [Peptococcaceae bacterium]